MELIEQPTYKTLLKLKQSVEAFLYLADITPDDDADKPVKSVVASRLKKDFEKHYVEVLKSLPD